MNLDRISFLSILYIIAWCLSPPLAYGTIYRVVAVISVLVLMRRSVPLATQVQRKYLNIAFSLCAYMIGIAVLLGEQFNIRVGTAIVLITGVIYEIWVLDPRVTMRQLKCIMYFSFALICIWNTTTILELLVDPRVMRILAKDSEVSEMYFLRGVGGFGYAYAVLIALPIALELFREKEQNRIISLMLLYCIGSSLMLVYLSQYFLCLLLAIITVLLVWKKPGKATYLSVIVAIAIISFYLEEILAFLIDVVELHTLHSKLVDMQDVLVNGADVEDSDFGERADRYGRDIDLILNSPLWGCFKFSKVGKHSDFLDFFAQFGIPLGIVYVKSLLRPAILWTKRNYAIAPIVLLLVSIMAVMNRFPLTATVPMCFLLPSYCKLLQFKTEG